MVKKTPESAGVWDKFEVGPTPEETTVSLQSKTFNFVVYIILCVFTFV